MKLVATNLFAGFMIVFVLLTFERGAQAADSICGTVGGQADGVIRSMEERDGVTSILAETGAKYSCSETIAIFYKGARALLSDCKPGAPFKLVGSLLRTKKGEYLLMGDVIRCG